MLFFPYASALTSSHQEDFYGFATLSLKPEELRLSVKKAHGMEWNPDDVGKVLSRQVLFVGIYDGYLIFISCWNPPWLISKDMEVRQWHSTYDRNYMVYLSRSINR